MKGKPPKLWLVWIYKNYSTDRGYIKKKIEKLFGKDAEVSNGGQFLQKKFEFFWIFHVCILICKSRHLTLLQFKLISCLTRPNS